VAIEVLPVRSRRDLERFLRLPWTIYRGNPHWVPPLISESRRSLTDHGDRGSAFTRQLFLVLVDGKPAGRIQAGVDEALNARKQSATGFFSLFECIDDQAVCSRLFAAAEAWLLARGITLVKGPVSPDGPNGDDCKGLLVDAFDRPPVLMTSYNPAYYRPLIEGCGYAKDFDVFAYFLDKDRLFARDPAKLIEYAERRYKFRVDRVNLSDLDNEIVALKRVLDLAVPADWPDMIPPTLEELRALAGRMRPIADPDLVVIARSGDEPVGFGIALPDLNQVLIRLNGRMTPLALLKYLYYRRRITWARIFVMFVVPAFRRKGVAHALYYHIFTHGVAKGYTHGEGSTIGETNAQMRADIEGFGGEHYKTYRVFSKVISSMSPPESTL
jgi:GNAT superfamily N-acetyltransferase